MEQFLFNDKRFQYMDEYGLILCQNRPTQPDGDNGMGDCIGVTHDACRAYDFIPNFHFLNGIESCFLIDKDVSIYRHPSMKRKFPNTMSRDHLAYVLITFHHIHTETGDKGIRYIKFISKYIKWKFSDKYSFTIDLWLYMKALAGSRIARVLYWISSLYIPFAVLYKKLVYWTVKVLPESNQKVWDFDDGKWEREHLLNRPLWQIKLIKTLKILPNYTTYQLAFMWDELPDSLIKRIMQRILRWGVDRQNYVVRMMLGDKNYTQDEIYGYKPMWGGRWTTSLDELNSCDLTLCEGSYAEGNHVDVALVRAIYHEKINHKFIQIPEGLLNVDYNEDKDTMLMYTPN